MQIEDLMKRSISRRSALKGGAAAVLASQGALLSQLAFLPNRPALAASGFPDIQFDNGAFVHGPATFNDGAGNVVAQFGVTFTLLAPARLTRNPNRIDQAKLANALATIEAVFPASPSGVLVTSVSYGTPYFARFNPALVAATMPRLSFDHSRFVLEEVPAGGFPTDVSAANPNVTKDRFNNTVVIERNDLLFELRSDVVDNLTDTLQWLEGSNILGGFFIPSPDFDGLISFRTARLQFVQPGLPRRVADAAFNQNNQLYEFHTRINPDSSMTMGMVDQQTNASAAPGDVIFASTGAGAGLTTARAGDYFDNGAIAHFSHDIEDLYQFYATANQDSRHPDGEPFTERVMYHFRANQLGTADGLPSDGRADQFTNGGGPAFINNVFQGNDSVVHEAHDTAGKFGPGNQTIDATFTGQGRIGHIAALHRHGRTASGQPLHIRNDGPGFDSLDVGAFQLFPGGPQVVAGTNQFKLQFLVFVPTAELFRQMRVGQAAQDLAQPAGPVDPDDNGLERFITATRRQNFLVPPRRHRSFPLVELT